MFCEKCGAELVNDSSFCIACGAKVKEAGVSAAAAQPGAPVPPPPPAQAPPPPPPPSYGPVSQTPPPAGFRPAAMQPDPQAYPQSYAPQPQYGGTGRAVGEVLSVGQYIGMFLLLCIPFLNLILLLVWGFGSTQNPNRKNFARASLLLAAITVVFAFIAKGAILGILNAF